MTSLSNQPSLRVQITDIDYALAQPGPLDNSSLPYVPVIRVFGVSSLGIQTCLVVHQVYPYFYVEYRGRLTSKNVERYILKLTRSLNIALALSLKSNPHSSKSQFIRDILLVKGVHFYGFHSSYAPFLKILVADPKYVHRMVAILQSGTIMETRFVTFESHLSFVLQFMCDYGLYGCGWIDLETVVQRDAYSAYEGEYSDHRMNNASFPASPYFRHTRVPLEVDSIAPHILNRHKLIARNMHHKVQIPQPSVPPEPLVPSVRELWEDERKRRVARGLDPSPEIPVDLSDSLRGSGGDWYAEAEWWEVLKEKLEKDREADWPPQTNSEYWEGQVMTTFESIEATWDEQWKTWQPSLSNEQSTWRGDDSDVPWDLSDGESDLEGNDEENIAMLSSQEISQLDQLEEAGLEWNGNEALDDDQTDHEEDDADEVHTQPSDPFQMQEANQKVLDLNLKSVSNSSSQADLVLPTTPTPAKHSTVPSLISGSNVLSADMSPVDYPPPQMTSLTFPKKTKLVMESYSMSKMGKNCYQYTLPPPSPSALVSNMNIYDTPAVYRTPYYSRTSDVPGQPKQYGGLLFQLKGAMGITYLEPWDISPADKEPATPSFPSFYVGGWEYGSSPPSVKDTQRWLAANQPTQDIRTTATSQIEGPSDANVYGLKDTPIYFDIARERQPMSILALEVFAPAQQGEFPCPESDDIVAVFYSYRASEESIPKQGAIFTITPNFDAQCIRELNLDFATSEVDLVNKVVDIVIDLDPDVMTGWDTQRGSWGYLEARGGMNGFGIRDFVSRAPSARPSRDNEWEMRHTSTFKVVGRHVLNMWRIVRLEHSLTHYSLENAAFNILQKRLPRFSNGTLSDWFFSGVPFRIKNVLRYFSDRTTAILNILSRLNFITKTAEFSRVFGVDFFSVISRGSQFKVESFLFRIAKPESFLLVSPSRQDVEPVLSVGKQNAAECMPLIMEPASAFYTSPLLVLDFQSLYPSIMIAYNYCYSTCLGRVKDFQGRNKLGVTNLHYPPGFLASLADCVKVAPNGLIYAKPEVRKGLLGRMLIEILGTRVMVKQAMKGVKNDKALRQILNARQLGLKYIANVTYGYTGATFSGRMPSVEIADSIVQSGRETLEKAISLINTTVKWGAKVVYGDTDSIFVYLRGKTREQAFRIGNEMADTVTALNPSPIKLRLEKVYHPCVLVAKKRYAGFKFESIDDLRPVFDAKGIETVRRDGVPAQRKMMEACLKTLFRTQDLSIVKDYCYKYWTRLLENKASIYDYVFAKEVRMGTYSEAGHPPPPGVVVAAKRLVEDPASEPQYGERIPYVIVQSIPESRLVDRAMNPLEMLKDSRLRLDAHYYISRVLIPPLERIFNLAGADIRGWYDEMPKSNYLNPGPGTSPLKANPATVPPNHLNIEEHFCASQCLVCGNLASQGLCDNCYWMTPQETMANLLSRIQLNERRLTNAHRICATCSSSPPTEPIQCESIDCPWLFSRKRAENRENFLSILQEIVEDLDETTQADVSWDSEVESSEDNEDLSSNVTI